MAELSRPKPEIMPDVRLAPSRSMSRQATSAPNCAKPRAIARPRPEAAPVTTAHLPSSRKTSAISSGSPLALEKLSAITRPRIATNVSGSLMPAPVGVNWVGLTRQGQYNPKPTLAGCLVQYAADLPRVAQGVQTPVTIELKVHSPH